MPRHRFRGTNELASNLGRRYFVPLIWLSGHLLFSLTRRFLKCKNDFIFNFCNLIYRLTYLLCKIKCILLIMMVIKIIHILLPIVCIKNCT